jgi:hypothetical protein
MTTARAGISSIVGRGADGKGGRAMTVQQEHRDRGESDETSGLILVLAVFVIAAALVLTLT